MINFLFAGGLVFGLFFTSIMLIYYKFFYENYLLLYLTGVIFFLSFIFFVLFTLSVVINRRKNISQIDTITIISVEPISDSDSLIKSESINESESESESINDEDKIVDNQFLDFYINCFSLIKPSNIFSTENELNFLSHISRN